MSPERKNPRLLPAGTKIRYRWSEDPWTLLAVWNGYAWITRFGEIVNHPPRTVMLHDIAAWEDRDGEDRKA